MKKCKNTNGYLYKQYYQQKILNGMIIQIELKV